MVKLCFCETKSKCNDNEWIKLIWLRENVIKNCEWKEFNYFSWALL